MGDLLTGPAIEAEDLTKEFKGGVKALTGVSFTVEPGTVFGLLGPNGAGKTTVVRILTTILKPDSGQARVLGIDVARHPGQVRPNIGLAGQSAAVDENLTGRENLNMIARLNHMSGSESRARAQRLLEQFSLTDAADRPLKTYSGGMRRRIDLGAALVANPPVLFLDEPTTGLDPHSRNDLWQVIEGLVSEGTTVLLTTQYLEEADRLAKRVAVVDHGGVIAEGTPTDLKAQLGSTVLSITLIDQSQCDKVMELLVGIGSRPPLRDGTSIEMAVDDGAGTAMEALRRLDQYGIVPSGFALREPSLDDVFFSLTGSKTGNDEEQGVLS